MRLRETPRALLAALALAALAGALALADTVYVKARNARMLDKPDAYEGKLVKRLDYRDKLQRTEKGEEWDKVESSGQAGYVRSRDLDTKQPPDTREQGSGWTWAQGGSDPTFTAGTRALGPLGKQYTSTNNLEAGRRVVEDRMDKMQLDPRKLEAFQREGRVGEFAGKEARK